MWNIFYAEIFSCEISATAFAGEEITVKIMTYEFDFLLRSLNLTGSLNITGRNKTLREETVGMSHHKLFCLVIAVFKHKLLDFFDV